jgi:rubrerythrin
MTDDRRPGDIDAELQATLAALYRILEDAQRYEEYADVSQRAYDEELADFFRELREESRERAERAEELLAQRLADGGVH